MTIDRVNTNVRFPMNVRPFFENVILHSETRLEQKEDENAPGPGKNIENWDEVSVLCLIDAAEQKLAKARMSWLRHEPVTALQHLADAFNFVGMSYDTIDQKVGE